MTSRIFPIAALLTLSCAPASPPPPAAAPASPPPAAAPPSGPPSARVTAVEPGKESAPGARAKILFSNPTPRPCTIAGYKLLWGSSTKKIKLDGLTVPPGETRERWIKVAFDDGDLSDLSPTSARVEIQADCGSP